MTVATGDAAVDVTADVRSRAARLRRFAVRAARMTSQLSPGTARSRDRGAGLEFDEVRAYVPGDDTRAIDWNVTARLRSPHVKVFRDDRDRRVRLLLDASGSMATAGKFAAARETLGTLALVEANHAASVRLSVCHRDASDAAAAGDRGGAMRLLDRLFAATAGGPDGAVEQHLRSLAGRRRQVVVLATDVYARPPAGLLAAVGRRHQFLVVLFSARVERTLPRGGLVDVRDPETGVVRTIDCGSRDHREAFSLAAAARSRDAARQYAAAGSRVIEADAAADPMVALRKILGRPGATS